MTRRYESCSNFSEFSDLVSDCVNSDNYLKQQYSIETTITLTVAVYLDEDTQFNLYIRHKSATPSAEVNDYDTDPLCV